MSHTRNDVVAAVVVIVAMASRLLLVLVPLDDDSDDDDNDDARMVLKFLYGAFQLNVAFCGTLATRFF